MVWSVRICLLLTKYYTSGITVSIGRIHVGTLDATAIPCREERNQIRVRVNGDEKSLGINKARSTRSGAHHTESENTGKKNHNLVRYMYYLGSCTSRHTAKTL